MTWPGNVLGHALGDVVPGDDAGPPLGVVGGLRGRRSCRDQLAGQRELGEDHAFDAVARREHGGDRAVQERAYRRPAGAARWASSARTGPSSTRRRSAGPGPARIRSGNEVRQLVAVMRPKPGMVRVATVASPVASSAAVIPKDASCMTESPRTMTRSGSAGDGATARWIGTCPANPPAPGTAVPPPVPAPLGRSRRQPRRARHGRRVRHRRERRHHDQHRRQHPGHRRAPVADPPVQVGQAGSGARRGSSSRSTAPASPPPAAGPAATIDRPVRAPFR